MRPEFQLSTLPCLVRRAGRLRLTTRRWMIAVAGTAVIFAAFGVNGAVGMVIVAFFVSALITKPDNWLGWIVLLLAARD